MTQNIFSHKINWKTFTYHENHQTLLGIWFFKDFQGTEGLDQTIIIKRGCCQKMTLSAKFSSGTRNFPISLKITRACFAIPKLEILEMSVRDANWSRSPFPFIGRKVPQMMTCRRHSHSRTTFPATTRQIWSSRQPSGGRERETQPIRREYANAVELDHTHIDWAC